MENYREKQPLQIKIRMEYQEDTVSKKDAGKNAAASCPGAVIPIPSAGASRLRLGSHRSSRNSKLKIRNVMPKVTTEVEKKRENTGIDELMIISYSAELYDTICLFSRKPQTANFYFATSLKRHYSKRIIID